MIHFANLTYSEAELEKDAIKYLKTQVYAPSYASKVKEFLSEDTVDFKKYYDDGEYGFYSIYYDEYASTDNTNTDEIIPKFDFLRLSKELEDNLSNININHDAITRYTLTLESEFRKNAYRSHMEPYFIGLDAVAAVSINGYTQNPICSIYSIVREWCLALHLKKMYPELMRRSGCQYQQIKENYSGEERLKKLIDFKEKYKFTIENNNFLRAIHSSIFAYSYLYIKSFITQETSLIEDFILEDASEPLEILLQGEQPDVCNFQAVKYALKELENGEIKGILRQDTSIDWNALYEFSFNILKKFEGLGNIQSLFGAEGIDSKSIQEFWNKSANMQDMLKILRRLAMDNSDPIYNQLIQMCEYRLGRPDKEKKKLERFIEMTRRFMARQAYEITRPRTMAQELLAAFPSVFLVYFQWHHSFRTIYPTIPESQVYAEVQKKKNQQAEDTLKMRISSEEMQKNDALRIEEKQKQNEETARLSRSQDEDRLRMIIQNTNNTPARTETPILPLTQENERGSR